MKTSIALRQSRTALLLGTMVLCAVGSARAALIDTWDAARLGLANGAAVTNWISVSNRPAELVAGLPAPTYRTNATPAGTPVVRFDGTNRLSVIGTNSPVGGRTSFSLVYVLKVGAPPTANANVQWWGQTGVVDAEQPGATADWGTVLNTAGNIGFGIGNADATIFNTSASLLDGNYHVAVFTWGGGSMSAYVDDFPPVTLTTGVPTGARNAANVSFGGIQTGEADRRFNGDLAEIRFYDNAMNAAAVSNEVASIAAKHGIAFLKFITNFSAVSNVISQGQSTTLRWEVASGPSVRVNLTPFGDVTSFTTNGIGRLTVTPTNDTLYTLSVTNAGNTRSATAQVVVNRTAATSLLEVWDAATLTATTIDGDPVSIWTGQNGRFVTNVSAAPVFKENATRAGTPAVCFSNSTMQADGPSNPVGGLNEFTLAYVFSVNAPPTANQNAQWWGQTGIIDAEQGGATADWGSSITTNGFVGLGIGNTDATLFSQTPGVADPIFHVVVATWGQGRITLYLDNRPPLVLTNNVPTAARNVAPMAFGGIVGALDARRLIGCLAEVRFYNDALVAAEATNVLASLIAKHGLFFPTVVGSFTATPSEINGGQSATLIWQVDAGSTVQIDQGVGDVTSRTTNGAGSISIAPTNDTIYTLIARDTNNVIRQSTARVVVNRTTAASLVDAWDAATLRTNLVNGSAVTNWISQSGRPATNSLGDVPLFNTNGVTPTVRFSNSVMRVAAANSPVGGLTEFSVAYVLKVNAPPTANNNIQWWGQTGTVDGEQGGATQDWGSSISTNGQAVFGIGNPDATAYGQSSVVDGGRHVVVGSWGQGLVRLYVDSFPPVIVSNAPTAARNTAEVAFGGIQTGEANRRLVGELAEVRFYNDSLSPAEIGNLIVQLGAKHGATAALRPRIISSRFVDTNTFVVRFQSIPGTAYSLLRRTNITDTAAVPVSSRNATAAETELVDTAAPNRQAFYTISTP